MPSPTAGMSFARLAVEDDMKIAQLMTKDVPRFSAELRQTPLRDVIGSGLAP